MALAKHNTTLEYADHTLEYIFKDDAGEPIEYNPTTDTFDLTIRRLDGTGTTHIVSNTLGSEPYTVVQFAVVGSALKGDIWQSTDFNSKRKHIYSVKHKVGGKSYVRIYGNLLMKEIA